MIKKILLKQSLFLVLALFFVEANVYANNNIAPCGLTTTWDGSTWVGGSPDITKTAIFIANYTIAADFIACSISVTTNATVTVNSGVNVTLENEVSIDKGSSLVFENTASLLQNTVAAVNIGSITYKRDTAQMRLSEYTYCGSPVSGQVFNGEFIGTPNNGDVAINVEGFDPFLKNHNFIGNPYPSAIDIVTMINNTNLGTLYFWTHNTAIPANVFTTGDFAVRTRSTGTAAIYGGAVPNQYVAAGQGFFVSAEMTTTINFTNTMRVGNNNTQFYRATQIEPLNYYIHLNLTNTSGAFKQIAVGYLEGATNVYEFGADALGSTESVVQFYSLIHPATYGFGIQARACPWALTDQILLSHKTTVAGDYNIAIDHNNVFFDNKDTHLEDTSNGIFHNIKTSSFTFTAAVETFNNRFKLHYRDLTLSIDDNLVNDSSLIVYSVDKTTKFVSNNINISTIERF
jgi:hypothetical protein